MEQKILSISKLTVEDIMMNVPNCCRIECYTVDKQTHKVFDFVCNILTDVVSYYSLNNGVVNSMIRSISIDSFPIALYNTLLSKIGYVHFIY